MLEFGIAMLSIGFVLGVFLSKVVVEYVVNKGLTK